MAAPTRDEVLVIRWSGWTTSIPRNRLYVVVSMKLVGVDPACTHGVDPEAQVKQQVLVFKISTPPREMRLWSSGGRTVIWGWPYGTLSG